MFYTSDLILWRILGIKHSILNLILKQHRDDSRYVLLVILTGAG
jgi:hypothetical protein